MKILRNAVLRKPHLTILPVIFGILFFASFQTTYGQTTTFAQFFEDDGSQDYSFTNNGSGATFNTVGGGSSIFFIYQNISGLDASLQGPQAAKLTMTSSTTTPATLTNSLDQPLNQTITITITRTTAAPVGVGVGSRTNLLKAVITMNTSAPILTGGNNATSGSFSAATGIQSITYTSDFLNFASTTQRDLGLSFSSVQPSLALGAGNFLQSFTAAATGTFASNPIPTVARPTAATVSISGRVLTSAGRGLRNALVTITQADGSTRTILTNYNGRYNFADVEIPQTIIVSVISKSYIYNPRVFSLDSDFAEADFNPVEGIYR